MTWCYEPDVAGCWPPGAAANLQLQLWRETSGRCVGSASHLPRWRTAAEQLVQGSCRRPHRVTRSYFTTPGRQQWVVHGRPATFFRQREDGSTAGLPHLGDIGDV